MQNVFNYVGEVFDGRERGGDGSSALLTQAGSGEPDQHNLALEILLGDLLRDHIHEAELRESAHISVKVHQGLEMGIRGHGAVSHLHGYAARQYLPRFQVQIHAGDLQREGGIELVHVRHQQRLAAHRTIAVRKPVKMPDSFRFLGKPLIGGVNVFGLQLGTSEQALGCPGQRIL